MCSTWHNRNPIQTISGLAEHSPMCDTLFTSTDSNHGYKKVGKTETGHTDGALPAVDYIRCKTKRHAYTQADACRQTHSQPPSAADAHADAHADYTAGQLEDAGLLSALLHSGTHPCCGSAHCHQNCAEVQKHSRHITHTGGKGGSISIPANIRAALVYPHTSGQTTCGRMALAKHVQDRK